jgi:hypothetical protein
MPLIIVFFHRKVLDVMESFWLQFQKAGLKFSLTDYQHDWYKTLVAFAWRQVFGTFFTSFQLKLSRRGRGKRLQAEVYLCVP